MTETYKTEINSQLGFTYLTFYAVGFGRILKTTTYILNERAPIFMVHYNHFKIIHSFVYRNLINSRNNSHFCHNTENGVNYFLHSIITSLKLFLKIV